MKATIAIDFDGPIHAYSKGWHDGTIYDEPTPGVAAALTVLRDRGYEIVIYSTRCYDRHVNGDLQANQVSEIREFLFQHGIPFDRIHTEPGKPICKCFIDDRAVNFQRWEQALRDSHMLGLIK